MKNKVVIITGASSGIGKALALEMASRGAITVLAARNVSKLQELEDELISLNCECMSVKTDVSIEQDCALLIDKTISKYGRIDVLINNAGISMRALFTDMDLSVMKQLMDVNFWGTVYCTKYAINHITKSKGSVVGIISIAGYLGLPARSAYSASKYAIRGFLDTIRVENLKTGVHVLVAAPGFTASNVRNVALTADGSAQGESPRDESKMMSAEDCALLITNAIVKRKRELIMTFVEGKFSVWLKKWWPTLMDKLTYNHMAKEPDSPLK